MVCLFQESYRKYYYAPWLSFPSCITLTVMIVLLFLPFFTAFSGEKFWSLIEVYYEHPVIRFNNEYMLYLDTADTINGITDNTLKSHSSFPELNTGNSGKDAQVISMTALKNETNHDDIIDSVQVKMIISKTPTEIVRNIKLMLFFDYILQKRARMQMQTMCYINIEAPQGITQLITNGDLTFKQQIPLNILPFIDTSKASNYFDASVNYNNDYDFNIIFDEFTINRNYTTKYEYTSRIKPFYSPDTVEIIANIIIPTNQQLIYEMSTAEALKFNWIKYLALFIPLLFIVSYFLGFIFKYRIFPCSVVSDLPKVIN